MTAQFTIVSKSRPTLIVKVEGTGVDETTARRNAIQFARARHRIFDPTPLDPNSHAMAVAYRQQVLAQNARPMPNLNPPSSWRTERSRIPVYDKR